MWKFAGSCFILNNALSLTEGNIAYGNILVKSLFCISLFLLKIDIFILNSQSIYSNYTLCVNTFTDAQKHFTFKNQSAPELIIKQIKPQKKYTL